MVAGMLLAGTALTPEGARGGGTPPPESYFTVIFRDEQLPADAGEMIEQAGGTLTYAVPQVGVAQVRGGAGVMERLVRHPEVLTLGPSLAWQIAPLHVAPLVEAPANHGAAGDLYARYQWDIQRVTADGASWRLNPGSHEVVVGVIDTGIYPHPDLQANLLPSGRNFVPAGGYQGLEPYETGDPTDVTDRNGHGTHVAGAIAANGRVHGVGPGLGVRAYRVFGNSGAMSEWVWAAMVAAADDGVDVINMSLGGYDILGQVFYVDPDTGRRIPLGNDVAYQVATRRVIRYVTDRGTTVVASAGNNALNATRKSEATRLLNEYFAAAGLPFTAVGATFSSLGGMPGVVTVSATGPDDSLASYSNYGPGFVSVAAPGGDFRRYPETGWWLDMNLSTWSLDSLDFPTPYAFTAGTSMAAPKVSATAALIIARHGKLPPREVARLLAGSADDLGPQGTDPYFGGGLVNAYRALGGE